MEKREDQQIIDLESEDDADQKDFNFNQIDTIVLQIDYNLKFRKVLHFLKFVLLL